MLITTLTVEEAAATGYTHRIKLTYADIKQWTSAAAKAIYPGLGSTVTVPAGTQVLRAAVNVVTAFTSSAGAMTLALIVGDDGDTDRYVATCDLTTAGSYAVLSPGYVYAAANTIDAIATIGTQTIDTLNAGEVDVYLHICDLNKLET